jgi:septal ring factor EnvC (AmiA/AmiB activator)
MSRPHRFSGLIALSLIVMASILVACSGSSEGVEDATSALQNEVATLQNTVHELEAKVAELQTQLAAAEEPSSSTTADYTVVAKYRATPAKPVHRIEFMLNGEVRSIEYGRTAGEACLDAAKIGEVLPVEEPYTFAGTQRVADCR